ncbi:UNVERIFIED_CONTAM: hypothetical protein Sradi_0680800 [Sesamum radiatum]|uniref:Uncharacterized protein n=1 Tax=Sesamum radiatum TaxID=300843 RepID=A0AAW2VMW1_SESRA
MLAGWPKTPGVMGAQDIFLPQVGVQSPGSLKKQTLLTRSTFEAELCALDTTSTETE